MGIVGYLSREPNGEPWPESLLHKKTRDDINRDFSRSSLLFKQSAKHYRRARRIEKILEHSEAKNRH